MGAGVKAGGEGAGAGKQSGDGCEVAHRPCGLHHHALSTEGQGPTPEGPPGGREGGGGPMGARLVKWRDVKSKS